MKAPVYDEGSGEALSVHNPPASITCWADRQGNVTEVEYEGFADMKSPIELFREKAGEMKDSGDVTSILLAISQMLYEEIEKLKPDPNMSAASMDVTKAAGSVVTDDRVPGSLKGVYRGAGK